MTIPANADIPEQGSLIDVKYLYAYKGGSIFQPTFLRPRTDVLEQECRMDRLTYRSEDKSVFQDVPSEPSLSL